MHRTLFVLICFLLLSPTSCARRGVVLIDPSLKQALSDELAGFMDFWLKPAKIAPPTIQYEKMILEVGGVRAYAEPFLLEDAEWNSWEGEGHRLFNNRLGLGFHVEVIADDSAVILWRPESTFIELNSEEDLNFASATAEPLILPLHRAASDQQRGGLDGDLVARLRAAHSFRDAYVPAVGEGEWSGVIVFPEVQPGRSEWRIVGDLRLTVTVQIGAERQILVWTFD